MSYADFHRRTRALRLGLNLLLLAGAAITAAGAAGAADGPVVGRAARMGVTPPLRELAQAPARTAAEPRGIREIPRPIVPRVSKAGPLAAAAADPVVQGTHPRRLMPSPLTTFEGVGNLDGVLPPDPNGDAGPNHYLAMVNMHFCVYDKVGGTNLMAPTLMSTLFAAAGFGPPASTTDDGDPIVLYDHLADRWLISQFIVSSSPYHEVIGISQTGDPTGGWYLYDFIMPGNNMNDYPHFGVWPDGYYMSDNQFAGGSTWAGAGVFVFERAKMLAGDPSATYQYFNLYGVDANYGGLLPCDLDGPAPPGGTPNYFCMMDDSWINPFDALYLWAFHVDWATPANSTFGNGGRPNYTNLVAAFDSAFAGGRNNIPQPGTSQKLDALSDRLMHRVQYRYFGTHDTLVTCHTVDADGADHAGVRYYQLKRALPGGTFQIVEQATFAPDAHHRWMGSAALDAQGNLAVGYSVSSTGVYPSIRYAGRLAADPSNSLYQGEATLHAGSGSQTHSAARWGDYSMLGVDPADGVTFWYINEYLPTTSLADWHTRIGSFRLADIRMGALAGLATNLLNGAGVSGAVVRTTSGLMTRADAAGAYVLSMPTGTYDVVAEAVGYHASPTAHVTIAEAATTTQHFALMPFPMQVTPAGGLSTMGPEGGPFAPPSAAYQVANAWTAALTWAASAGVPWLTLTPATGTLAAGQSVAVTAAVNFAADFLPTGVYSGTLVFTNRTGATFESRSLRLEVLANEVAIECFDFETGLPPGWLIRDNAGSGAQWRFDNPGGRANLTGGSGAFAIADSDYEGTVPMNTELVTEGFDLRGAGLRSASFRFKTDFYVYSGGEYADLDASTNGSGGPWTNVWRRTGSSLRGPATVTAGLPASVLSASNTVLRFHYYGANYDWWWQVDDVCLQGRPSGAAGALDIQPLAGLTASGYCGGSIAGERPYRLTNTSVAAVAWTGLCSVAWAELRQAGGTLAAGGWLMVTARITAAASALPPGAYAGTLLFSNRTQGATQTRTLALDVRDTLGVSPAAGLTASGLEGGPFTPTGALYTLANASGSALAWTGLVTAAWLECSAAGGTLDPGATQTVAVTLRNALLTAPGLYTGSALFSNLVTGVSHARAATVTVVEITGDLAALDSVPPADDRSVPFGAVNPRTPRTEQITVTNRDAAGGRNVVVSNIFLGLYLEDFNDGLAQGWREDVDGNWSVTGGEYAAQSAAQDYLTAAYTGPQVWGDLSAQADVRRTGDPNNAAGLCLRTSADLDVLASGSGYLFLIATNRYAVFRVNGPAAVALQGWTVGTAIKTGTAANRLLATAQGTQLHFFINGTLVWSGADATLAAGMIALEGYTTPAGPTAYAFDNVVVGRPVRPTLAMGRKQLFLNTQPQPDSRPAGPDHKTAPSPPPDPPDGEPLNPDPVGIVSGPFSLTNLPAVPLLLPPGESRTLEVTYAPRVVGSNVNDVTIISTDNDEPSLSVGVSGRAESGAITGRVTAAHNGAGLVGATVVADCGWTNWATATGTNGDYVLPVTADTYDLTASLARYATGTVAGVVVADGATVGRNFTLSGSVLSYAPTGIAVTLRYGQKATNAVLMSATGPLAVQYRLTAVSRGGVGTAPVQLGPFEGTVPVSGEPSQPGKAPARKALDSPQPAVPAPSRVLCYGVDMLNRDLVSFYSDTPGTFSVIGDSGANLIPCVDFLNGRFGTLYALDYSANALVTYVTTSAARTVVGSAIPEAGHAWTGLAGDPDGTLYASSTDGSASRLYRINPATGAATLVGDIANGPVVIAIAVNALGEMYAHEIANDVLLRVDKATGAGTVLGSTGFDANYAQGMDFDDVNNVLYLAAYNNGVGRGELRVADLATGNTALIGPFASDVELCMAVAAGGPVPWVTLVPGEGTVAVNGSTNFSVVFDTAPLPNRALTNFADVRFDGTFVNAVTNLSLTLAVIPDDLTVAPADRRATTGLEGGPFAPISFVFAVTNRGASSIGWTVSDDAAWLNTLSAGGTLAAGAGTPVTTVVNAVAAGLPIGSYTADVAFVNSASGVAQHRFVDLQVRPPAPDYFTELFAGTGADTNDLDFLMLTLRPDGSSSHYSACLQRISQYPTDPVGGTVLTLADDAFVPVNLTGNVRVRLYGIAYSNLFVGSNGYITFGRGTNVWVESFAAHFALPRVAGLFDDLDPSARGQVSWRQLPDRIAVTWDNVPEFGVTSTNQFQITMHTNGMIRIAWLRITANDGLAGLSAGLGQPGDFGESDLSAYEPCSVQIAASVTGRGRIAPSGTVTVVTGGNTDFLVNADTYYHVADVRTNAGTVGGGLGPGTLQFGFVWSNITENGTVVGYVGETVTTNTGTPYWWLAQYGFTNNFEVAATNDADGDGVPTGDEYPSDMDPTNRASWFAVRAVSNLPPLRVFFPSSSNRQYTLEYRTNLSAGAWQAMPGQSNLTGADGLWFLSDTNNPAPPRFFRIRAGTK